jgi:sulfatase maturation enzyme AslB (radical SAM superfamily)
MYRYSEINNMHVELSSNCQASCPMCARNQHGGLENPLIKVKDIDVELFKQSIPPSLVSNLAGLTLCGNFGDPLLNNDLIPIVEYLGKANPNIQIDLHTNGSLRNKAWWVQLAQTLTPNSRVHFALDGLADTHALYRVGTDFDKILDNAKTFIAAGGKARWVYITFKHNEHQIEEAKQMAKDLGFESFFEKQTSRFIGDPYFEVLDKKGKVTHKLEGPTEQKLIFIDKKTVDNYKEIFKSATIECDVAKTKSIYVDALGYLWPCCFVGAVPYLYTEPGQIVHGFQQDSRDMFFKLVDKFGGMEQFNLRNRSIEEIVNSNEWQTIWTDSFTNNPLRVCTRTCGKFSTPTLSQSRDQFLNLKEFNE